MKNLAIFLIAVSSYSYAIVDPLETTLIKAKNEAVSVKVTCIDTPPVTSQQVAWCHSHYSIYTNYLTQLQAPNPLTVNLGNDGYTSPYSWSPYDICRYEPGRLINEGLC